MTFLTEKNRAFAVRSHDFALILSATVHGPKVRPDMESLVARHASHATAEERGYPRVQT